MSTTFLEQYKQMRDELKKRHKKFNDENEKLEKFDKNQFANDLLSQLKPEQVKSILDKYSPLDYLIFEKVKQDKQFRKEVVSRL